MLKRTRRTALTFGAVLVLAPLMAVTTHAAPSSGDEPNCVFGLSLDNTGDPWSCVAALDPSWVTDDTTGVTNYAPPDMIAREEGAIQQDLAHGAVDQTEGAAELAALTNNDPGATSPARDASASAVPVGSTSGDPDGEQTAEDPNAGAQLHCNPFGCYFRYNNDYVTFDSYNLQYGWYDYDGTHHGLGVMWTHQRWSLTPPPPRSGAKNYTENQWGYIDFGVNHIGWLDLGGALYNGAARWSGGSGTRIGTICTPFHHDAMTGNYNVVYPDTNPYCTKSDVASHDHSHLIAMVWDAYNWNINFWCFGVGLAAHSNSLYSDANYYFHTFGFTHYGFTGIKPTFKCGAPPNSLGYVTYPH